MNVEENIGGERVGTQEDKTRVLLTNRAGSFLLLGNQPSSRFEGLCFRDGHKAFRTLVDIRRGKVSEVTHRLVTVERDVDGIGETLFMPDSEKALVVEYERETQAEIVVDCKELYDNREWGREYDVKVEQGCVIIHFRKRNDPREPAGLEFECYLAISGDALDFLPVQSWEEQKHPCDEARRSPPFSSWVYRACRVRGRGFAVAFALERTRALDVARRVWRERGVLLAKREGMASKLVEHIGSSDAHRDIAAKCALHAVDALRLGEEGILAGLPWFFQLWARDELISLKALMLPGHERFVRDVLLRHISRIEGTVFPAYPGNPLSSADAPGWLFLRVEDFLRHLDAEGIRKAVLSDGDMRRIRSALERYLDACERSLTPESLAPNGPLETWMDTASEGDTREGCRVEIQALVLASCRLFRDLNLHEHRLEKRLRAAFRKHFWTGNYVRDGLNDDTVRPNVFIAAYACPELLTPQEWASSFKVALSKLWLAWGGLSSIEQDSPLFVQVSTGEDVRSYHRGDSWFWINNMAALVMHRMDPRGFKRYIDAIVKASTHELLSLGIAGYAAELSSAKRLDTSCSLAQTWSNALYVELIREVG